MVKIEAAKEFQPVASSQVSINSIFVDSVDNIFKKKNYLGVVSNLEGADAPERPIIPTENIYDDFTTYTPGVVLDITKWDVVKTVTGVTATDDVSTVANTLFGTDQNQTQCGRISVTGTGMQNASGTITATTKTALTDKNIYMRAFFSSAGTSNGIGATAGYGWAHKILVGNATDGFTVVFDHQLSTAIRTTTNIVESAATSLIIRAKGNNVYDVFCGGKNISISKPNGIKVQLYVNGYVSSADFAFGVLNNYCYFENLTYSD